MSVRSVLYSVCAFLGVLILSFSEAHATQSVIEKIIGQNDLLAVNADATNVPFKFRNTVDAFGKIAVGCTATHIGNGYVLTAGHCFFAGETVIKDQHCESSHDVEWGVREGKSAYLTSKCTRLIIAQRTSQADYALFKVDPAPDAAVLPELRVRSEVGDRVTLFSHPNDMALRWSRMCRIQRVASSEFSTNLIHHVCDTNPGSSGASIINASTLKVVGIHDGGFAPNGVGYNYGTYLMDTPLKDILLKLGF